MEKQLNINVVRWKTKNNQRNNTKHIIIKNVKLKILEAFIIVKDLVSFNFVTLCPSG